MNRSLPRTVVTMLCAAVASILLTGAAQAAPNKESSVTAVSGSRDPISAAITQNAAPVGTTVTQLQGDRFEGTLFRTYHHDEWSGWKLKRYYFYVSLAAPSDIGQERWDQLLSFSKCAVDQAAQAAVIAIVTGGISLADAMGRLGIIAANCGAVNPEDIARASIFTYVGR